jgi:hypothetical protein
MWKTFFRKKGIKSWWEGLQPKFQVTQIFLTKIDEKKFSRSGAPCQRFEVFNSKAETRNFCQLWKNVFSVLPTVSKNRRNRGLFLRVRRKLFFINLY